MAFPTTLALITALWSGPARTQVDRALVGARRRASPRSGPLLSGALLEHFDWGSVFLDHPAARGRRAAHGLALRPRPRQRDDATRSTTSAASSRSLLVGGAGAGDQLRAGARTRDARARARGDRRSRPRSRFVLRQRRARVAALRPRRRGPPHLLGRGLRRDHRLRLADGRDVRRPAVPPERARLLDARRRAGDPARRRCCMVLVAPRSAKLVEAHGARFTLLVGYVFCLLGFLTMLLLWKDGIAYWKVGLGYALIGIGVGFAGTPASHSLTGSVPVTARRHGLGHRRPPARPRRRDHAVDPRRRCSPPATRRRSKRRSRARPTRPRSPTTCRPS